MCVDCHKAGLKLAKAGYNRDFISMYLWNFTPYPVASALPLTERFLKVRRRNRRRWLRHRQNRFDRALRDVTPERSEAPG